MFQMDGGAAPPQAFRPSTSRAAARRRDQHAERRQLVRRKPGDRAGRVYREQHRFLPDQRYRASAYQYPDERAHRLCRLLGRRVSELRRCRQCADEYRCHRWRSTIRKRRSPDPESEYQCVPTGVQQHTRSLGGYFHRSLSQPDPVAKRRQQLRAVLAGRDDRRHYRRV